MQTVGDLDQNDADVLAHGKEHLAQVLHLLVFLGGILDTSQLTDALHQIGDGRRKQLRHVLMGRLCVLDDVMQQRRDDGLGVQLLVRHDLSDRQGVDDIGLTAFALLAFMTLVSVLKSRANLAKVRGGVIASYGFFQQVVLFLQGHSKSPQFRLVGSSRKRER